MRDEEKTKEQLIAELQDLRQRLVKAEESERILEALMEHIPEGITIADAPDGRIRMVSRYGQQLLGRSEEYLNADPIGRHGKR